MLLGDFSCLHRDALKRRVPGYRPGAQRAPPLVPLVYPPRGGSAPDTVSFSKLCSLCSCCIHLGLSQAPSPVWGTVPSTHPPSLTLRETSPVFSPRTHPQFSDLSMLILLQAPPGPGAQSLQPPAALGTNAAVLAAVSQVCPLCSPHSSDALSSPSLTTVRLGDVWCSSTFKHAQPKPLSWQTFCGPLTMSPVLRSVHV